MDTVINYLSANPLLAIAAALILIVFLFLLIRKLIKWAIILFIIFAIVVTFIYKGAKDSEKPKLIRDLEKKSEQVIQKVDESIEKGKEKVKDNFEPGQKEIKETIEDKQK
jgi:membrane protein implicated in regulation of membrane protease activity